MTVKKRRHGSVKEFSWNVVWKGFMEIFFKKEKKKKKEKIKDTLWKSEFSGRNHWIQEFQSLFKKSSVTLVPGSFVSQVIDWKAELERSRVMNENWNWPLFVLCWNAATCRSTKIKTNLSSWAFCFSTQILICQHAISAGRYCGLCNWTNVSHTWFTSSSWADGRRVTFNFGHWVDPFSNVKTPIQIRKCHQSLHQQCESVKKSYFCGKLSL